jgi:hypothetical protein
MTQIFQKYSLLKMRLISFARSRKFSENITMVSELVFLHALCIA